MKRIKKFGALVLSLLLVLSLAACGGSGEPDIPETTEAAETTDLSGFTGWWQRCSEFSNAPAAYLYLDGEALTGSAYDEDGEKTGDLICMYEGGTMDLIGDGFELSLLLEGDFLAEPDGAQAFQSIPELPEKPEESMDLDGKWYFNNKKDQYLEFSGDTYEIFDGDGQVIETDTFTLEYENGETLSGIELEGSMNSLSPVPGQRAFLEDTLGKYNAYLAEELLDTPEAEQIMQRVRVLNMQFVTAREELEYPTGWRLSFYPGYFRIVRSEARPDTNHLFDESSGIWTVTPDGILEMEVEDPDTGATAAASFDLNENEQTLELPFYEGRTFTRDPGYPAED